MRAIHCCIALAAARRLMRLTHDGALHPHEDTINGVAVAPPGGVDHNAGAAATASLVAEKAGQRSTCSSGGDPHINTFDVNWKGGSTWHPMHAPNHWWAVHSANHELDIQVKYDRCGIQNGGGWMSATVAGIPRTCNMGMSISGQNANGHYITVQTPCAWDWFHTKCHDGEENRPVILFDGIPRAETFTEDGIKVTKHHQNSYRIDLPDGTEVHVNFGCYWGSTAQYFNYNIVMNQPSYKICGHCGNFDGNSADETMTNRGGTWGANNMYDVHGMNIDAKPDPLCVSLVSCEDRRIPDPRDGCPTGPSVTRGTACGEKRLFCESLVNVPKPLQALLEKKAPPGEAEGSGDRDPPATAVSSAALAELEGPTTEAILDKACDGGEQREKAMKACEPQFQALEKKLDDKALEAQELEDCVRDVCETGTVEFAEADAEEALEDTEVVDALGLNGEKQ